MPRRAHVAAAQGLGWRTREVGHRKRCPSARTTAVTHATGNSTARLQAHAAQARLVRSGPTHAGHVIRELYMAAPHMTATCGRGRDDYCRPRGAAGNAERRDVAAVACAHAWSMVDVWFSTEYIMHVHRRRQRESYLARCRRKASARDRYRSPVYIDAASPVSYRRPVHWLLIWCMCMLRYALAMFWKCPALLPL